MRSTCTTGPPSGACDTPVPKRRADPPHRDGVVGDEAHEQAPIPHRHSRSIHTAPRQPGHLVQMVADRNQRVDPLQQLRLDGHVPDSRRYPGHQATSPPADAKPTCRFSVHSCGVLLTCRSRWRRTARLTAVLDHDRCLFCGAERDRPASAGDRQPGRRRGVKRQFVTGDHDDAVDVIGQPGQVDDAFVGAGSPA